MIYAPPGSGYATPEDEQNLLPESYEPMMEYPGTMRPGRTPENQPFHDLPIGDDDPDPVPWPHFQQIEWHHRWEPPHPHPIPMEEFIEMHGRWATPEVEAEMRAGARRDVQQRKEQAENERKSTLIVDDEDDDISDEDVNMELGDGMFGQLGSPAEDAITAEAVSSENKNLDLTGEEDDFDEFLLDLGLDAPDIGDIVPVVKPTARYEDDDDVDLDLDLGFLDDTSPVSAAKATSAPQMDLSLEDEEFEDNAAAAIEDDDGLDMGLEDDDDELAGDEISMVPLEDFGDDQLDDDDSFDDGGFDYDEGDFGDFDGGGDAW
jgi:hypothetical protein